MSNLISYFLNVTKYVFFQDIYRLPDEKLVVKARVDTVCMLHGQLMRSCQELDDIFFPE